MGTGIAQLDFNVGHDFVGGLRLSRSLEAKALYAPKMATCYTHPFGHELPSKLRMDEELSQCLSTFLSQFDGSTEAISGGGLAKPAVAAVEAGGDTETSCELA